MFRLMTREEIFSALNRVILITLALMAASYVLLIGVMMLTDFRDAWLHYTIATVFTLILAPLAAFPLFVMSDRLQVAKEGLEGLLRLDALTELPNRRAFFERTEEIFARGGALTLMMIDVDHFKVVNDSHGHDLGDRVLCSVAHSIQRIASDYVSHQAGDGTVLHMAHINSHALMPNLQKLNYDAEKDFQPIAMVGVTPNLLICGQMQPAKNVKDLVALCKANPGRISFGSAGPGSAQHMALEMFMLQAGVKAIHVPYKGSGPMLTDLIGGQVQYSFDTMTAATPHVKGGKAIALALTLQKRASGHPNVPTMSESGVVPSASMAAISSTFQFLSLVGVMFGTPPLPSGAGPPAKRLASTMAPSALRGE